MRLRQLVLAVLGGGLLLLPATSAIAEPPRTALAPAPSAPTAPIERETTGVVQAVTERVDYLVRRDLTFSYPGADYVKVHFSRLALRPGDTVRVSNRGGSESRTYTKESLEGLGNWALSVSGDTAIVGLHTGGQVLGKLGDLTMVGLGIATDKVARGFTAEEKQHRRTGREESVCGRDDARDAVCYKGTHPTEYGKVKPVARLLIDGTSLCTAWRIGPNNRMITNSHCFTSTSEARVTEIWFNYECLSCGGGATTQAVKVTGDRVLKTDPTLDYTLFTVSDFNAIKPFGQLDVDARIPAAGEEIYIPQHPGGGPKQIALSSDTNTGATCRVDFPTYEGYDTDTDVGYRCDTAGGSSGSPVISKRTHKVIALHHFGGCPNSGVRLDLIYRQIKPLL